jgi:hypothetical protein
MNALTRANWLKLKTALEAAGKTDCFYYKRALAITAGNADPMSSLAFANLDKLPLSDDSPRP